MKIEVVMFGYLNFFLYICIKQDKNGEEDKSLRIF